MSRALQLQTREGKKKFANCEKSKGPVLFCVLGKQLSHFSIYY